uniref:Aldehyde dehydrogenase n=1 Tax=Cryptocotyle lingua TaxID=66766 RepID=A0A7U0TI79_9TREM|nr:aldehyde dehydrogenase family 3 member A2 [Cryptocotyle lingua]
MSDSNHAKIVCTLREGFKQRILENVEARKAAIRSLCDMLEENEDAILAAIGKDFYRPKNTTVFLDIVLVKREAGYLLRYMDDFLKDEAVPRSFTTVMDTCYIQRQPLGVVLIMGAWNYPLFTLLLPALGALAAGNTVLLKPSESCPNNAQLLATLVTKYMDKKICQVICGGVDVCQKLLASERFDHITYTGGIVGGKAVYAAAAKFLTPVTLELGGKCPTYIDSDVDLMLAIKRTLLVKTLNCGQTCVAPDYVLCHRDVLDELVKNLGVALEEFFGKDVRSSPDLGRMVNEMHWKRVTKLLSETKGKIVYGGDSAQDDLYIAPTVVINVKPDDSLMSEELFGPILPILTVDSPEEAIEFIRSRAHPLAVCVFTNNSDVFSKFKQQTTSGALIHNDSATHGLCPGLPFGGVGDSGFGRYLGRFSIDTFSNPRSVLLKNKSDYVYQNVVYPPYTEKKLGWIRWLMSTSEKKSCAIM